jgi:hypothetical protein
MVVFTDFLYHLTLFLPLALSLPHLKLVYYAVLNNRCIPGLFVSVRYLNVTHGNTAIYTRFELLTAVTLYNMVFCILTLCTPVGEYQGSIEELDWV